ncbi:MAG TPA: hypothetical protein VGB53_13580 [Rubricoccaceae bacterium]|jgi:hypothetical protein
MARPTKLTHDIQSRICTALKAGNTRASAAEYGGITASTFYEWMKRGQKPALTAKGAITAKDLPFSEFSDAVTRAESDCEMRQVAIVLKAASSRTVTTVATKSKDIMVGRGEQQKKVTLIEETVTTHEEIDWKASAWWLERRNPKEWKRVEARELSGPDGAPIRAKLDVEAPGLEDLVQDYFALGDAPDGRPSGPDAP